MKDKLRGTRAQAVRDFLSSGSYKSCLLSAKGDEFSAGFGLAVDQMIHNHFLSPGYDIRVINEELNSDGSKRPLVAAEDDMDMDLVGREEF